ncbi:MAG: hypothetical protein R2851_16900 [Caldilineaceae bacterium]
MPPLAHACDLRGRAEFATIVNGCPALPAKHTLTSYVHSHAITECFWPIYSFGKMLPPHLNHEVEALYERVRALFAPTSRRSIGSLQAYFRKYENRERWLATWARTVSPTTKRQRRMWQIGWNGSIPSGKIGAADLLPYLADLLADEEQKSRLIAFVESQVTVTRALFAFRDSFQGPKAVIYDPSHIFSSQTVNEYDLFHLVRNYHLSPPLTRRQFLDRCTETELTADFYFQLIAQRETGLVLEFVYATELDVEDFEKRRCQCPVGLSGLRLQVRDRGGDVIAGGLDHAIVSAIEAHPLLLLIVPPDSVGLMINKLRGTSLWAHRMTVRFPNGTLDEGYKVLVGTAAFHAHAELLGHFLMKDRLREDAIIL